VIKSIVGHPTDIVSIHYLWIFGEEPVSHLIGGIAIGIRIARRSGVDAEEWCSVDFTVCNGALARGHVVDGAVEVDGLAGLEGCRYRGVADPGEVGYGLCREVGEEAVAEGVGLGSPVAGARSRSGRR